MYSGKKIIVVIPAYNEEKKIKKVIDGTPKDIVDEVLIVDDGSTDGTLEKIQRSATIILKNEINRGVGYSLRKGYEYAVQNGFDVCVTIGADDQEDKSEIIKLVKCVIDEGYDYVQGSRYLEHGFRDMPLSRLIQTKLFTFLFNVVTGKNLSDASNGFRAFRTDIFERGKIEIHRRGCDRYELEPYMLIQILKSPLKFKEVPVKKYYDKKGYTKMKPIIDWWRICKPLFIELFGLNSLYYKKVIENG